jgi:hypothetical protein
MEQQDIISIDTSIKGFMLSGRDDRPMKIVAGGSVTILIQTPTPIVSRVVLHPSGLGVFQTRIGEHTPHSFKLVIINKGKVAKHYKALIYLKRIEDEGK